jgi:hypothetical protein
VSAVQPDVLLRRGLCYSATVPRRILLPRPRRDVPMPEGKLLPHGEYFACFVHSLHSAATELHGDAGESHA